MIEAKRSELSVESKMLRRRAVWCGIVFALAIQLLTLNVLPPVSIEYSVRNEVLVSPARLERLVDLAHRHAETWFESTDPIRIQAVKVLDEDQTLATRDAETLLLVEITTNWRGSFSEEVFQAWLSESTTPSISDVDQELAAQSNFAKWQLRTAQHYVAHQKIVQMEREMSVQNRVDATSKTVHLDTPTEEPPAKFTLAGGGTTAPTSLASLRRDVTSDDMPGNSNDQARDQMEATALLAAKVREAEQQLASIGTAWQSRLEKSGGVMEFAEQAQLKPIASGIPVWMAASVLILGCCAAASAGWLQHRLNAGGVFEPNRVAKLLQSAGIPLAGVVTLEVDHFEQRDWADRAKRHASNLGRIAGRHLTRISEWALWFWVYMIALRFVLDPMWRAVLWDSPLAALGRVVVGMP